MISESIFTVIGTAITGAVGWVFVKASSLANRVSVLETRDTDMMNYLKIRFDGVDSRLTRIEKKQDKDNA